MNKRRTYTAEEVAVILMTIDSSDEGELFDVAVNELISNEDVDNVDTEAFEDDSNIPNDSESFNPSELNLYWEG